MASRRISNVDIYDGTEAKIIDVINAEQVKTQAVGVGTYTIMGRLDANCPFDTICAIKASDFAKKSSITDTSVYNADVSGYAQITVEASGVDKIVAVLIG